MRLVFAIAGLLAAFFAGRRRARVRRPAAPPALPAVRPSWRQRLGTVAAFVGVMAVGGALVVASGVVPIKASSGHWAVTRWLLEFASSRSVATHTLGGPPPPALDDPALVLRGAGHYDTGCRPCHGAPDLPSPSIAAAMTPSPPYLPPAVPKWEADELFYIVKHGVKFTGMPAWPAQGRDDEVWAMVAFLVQLPGMSADAYRRLAHGEAREAGPPAPMEDLAGLPSAPPAVQASCARCHGADGLGRGTGAFPRLAGQRPSYLYAALDAYARGTRPSGVMEPVARGLSDADRRALARYYARQPAPAAAPAADASAAARGEAIARDGVPQDGIPSCADCHGPGHEPRNPFYPDLAGQYAAYLVQQLELFRDDRRGGSAYARLMHPTAHRLTPAQVRDVAAFYASLGPGAP